MPRLAVLVYAASAFLVSAPCLLEGSGQLLGLMASIFGQMLWFFCPWPSLQFTRAGRSCLSLAVLGVALRGEVFPMLHQGVFCDHSPAVFLLSLSGIRVVISGAALRHN